MRRRPSRSSAGLRASVWCSLIALVALSGCASAPPPRREVSAEAQTALARLEERDRQFSDLRTAADIRIRRDGKNQRLAGALLLRAPASIRFEALTPFGIPAVLVAGDLSGVTLWEVLDNRAFILPASPDATRRWLGLPLGAEDLVAIMAGRVLPMKDPVTVDLLPADVLGPSLVLVNGERQQRIWLDPLTGQPKQVEWTGGKEAARISFDPTPVDAPPAGLTMSTLDGKLEAVVRYRNPQMNTGFDPSLLTVTVPEHVKIRDFR